ncbi:hypothetical protein BUALT_Bualt15G0002400 [Buddleja alternifolia]|uniref:Uncharacterized protein n=1 Tax=Buddleja alternifolia TaxID=168488 RepID=A0AAV6WJ71_9LAMI|nr:hypothetical protein BUALT_Bualt15G0002400 [Buddleja alternifolia]
MKMVLKWQKFAAIQRKGIAFNHGGLDTYSTSSVVDKGHFVVYTADEKRYVVPLAYLNSSIFRELLKMSEQEYGLPSDGPIILPCDSLFMEFVICSIRQDRAGDLHETFLKSVASSCCSSSCLYEGQMNAKMISPKKLLKMARKWQMFACIQKKRISFPRNNQDSNINCCSTSTVVDKGHFAVYTADRNRFVIPLAYLQTEVFRQLLKMAEDEFGLPSDGPITLPCDKLFMNYIISLIQRGASGDVQKALLTSVAVLAAHLNICIIETVIRYCLFISLTL